MTPSSYEQKFRDTLAEILQLDHAELDFGIYRIMNQKRQDIESFLNNRLVPEVRAILQANTSDETEREKAELQKLTETLKAAGVNPDETPKVKELKAKIAAGADIAALENEVFSHLAKFFGRYYEGGDFVSKRRYKDGTYVLPYSGEEVKLYWANADQYYIKTSEYFKNYAFLLPTSRRKVHFVLRDAETEQNNNKTANNMERRFQLSKEDFIAAEDGELNIYFTYELMPKATKQDALIKEAEAKITPMLSDDEYADFAELITVKAPTEKNKDRTLLMKHLQDYTAKNNFDYFIHKDLGGFLRRELDFYIKNEVMFLDDLDANHIMEHLAQVKAIKQVGEKIITFLAQLEDFQKKLWLKKKFVVGCDYCITLDRIPRSLYPEIIANKAQRKEWVRLFAIDEIAGDLTTEAYSEPLTEKFLVENPYLVLDTKFFRAEFKHKLIGSMENVDEECNGLLIKSDNYQGLSIIQERYNSTFKCVYIDPPYNTGTDGFVYKDSYKHSSWLSMMANRFALLKNLYMKKQSSIIVSINENELFDMKILMDETFEKYLTTMSIKVRHEDRILKGDKDFHEVYESAVCYGLTEDFKPEKRHKDNTSIDEYKYSIKLLSNPLKKIEMDNKLVEFYAPDQYVLVKEDVPNEKLFKAISVRGSIREGNSSGRFYTGNLEYITNEYPGYLFKVYGIGDDGLGYRFFKTPNTDGKRKNGDYFQGMPVNRKDIIDIPYPNFFDFEKDFNNATDEGGVEFRNGKKPLAFMKQMLLLQGLNLDKNAFVLDYFGGSGSTSHAVIWYNRADNGDRKFVSMEMGEHFDNILKPRIEKVIYSEDWKDGKPVSRKGISQCFKYIRLEQYEDTLNNLQPKSQRLEFEEEEDKGDFKETYFLRYMLDTETKGDLFNLEWFVNPFALSIKTTKDNELIDTHVDMVETFNYLIGLNVETMRWPKDGYCVVEGTTHIGNERTLMIWRNCEKVSNEDLNEFFRKQAYSTTDTEFDKIYVNGDNTLPNIKKDDEHWKVVLIEEEFKKRMFD